MTNDEAHHQAMRRWGDKAITHQLEAPLFPSGFLFKVGRRETLSNGDTTFIIHGIGQTWEDAFTQADHYERRRRHRNGR